MDFLWTAHAGFWIRVLYGNGWLAAMRETTSENTRCIPFGLPASLYRRSNFFSRLTFVWYLLKLARIFYDENPSV
jgi:hypothetical protein